MVRYISILHIICLMLYILYHTLYNIYIQLYTHILYYGEVLYQALSCLRPLQPRWRLKDANASVRTSAVQARGSLQRTPESWNMGLGGLVLGSPLLYLKGMRILIFQLSGFYYSIRP